MGGLVFLGGAFSALPILVLLALLVVVALRQDDDASDERAPAIYGAVIALVGLLTLLVAVTGVASAVAAFTDDEPAASVAPMMRVDDDARYGGRLVDDGHDDDWRALAGFAIAGAAAVALLAVHRPLLAQRSSATGAARRVHRAFLAVLCLVTAIVAVIAAGVAVFDVLKVAAPGVFGDGDRADAARDAVPLLVLFLGAAALWRRHWHELGVGQVTAADAP